MDEVESKILKLIEILYDVNESEKEGLLNSFKKSSEEDKKEILKVLFKAYIDYKSKTKILLTKINKINNDVEEFKEHLNADSILDQID